MSTFRRELAAVINKHSKENGSNTPDYILADYLINCLKAFDTAVMLRENWYHNQEIVNMPEDLKNFYKKTDEVVDKIVAESDGKIKRSRVTFEEAENQAYKELASQGKLKRNPNTL
jgi:hypothetical protein